MKVIEGVELPVDPSTPVKECHVIALASEVGE